MQLTQDQLAAARARGCAFLSATEDQVRRLTAQRRIFRVGGGPFVATRDGGFFETWATLAALIEKHRPAVAEQGVGMGTAAAPEHGAPNGVEPPPATAPPDAATAGRSLRETPTAPRGRRAPRTRPAPATTDTPPTAKAAAEPSEAGETLAALEEAQGSGARARVVKRWRAGEPPTQRWMVAGKMRRGRLPK